MPKRILIVNAREIQYLPPSNGDGGFDTETEYMRQRFNAVRNNQDERGKQAAITTVVTSVKAAEEALKTTKVDILIFLTDHLCETATRIQDAYPDLRVMIICHGYLSKRRQVCAVPMELLSFHDPYMALVFCS